MTAASHLRRCLASGLSLLEMLVVLVLTSLLSTLLIQGLGLFFSTMDRVQRYSARAAEDSMPQHWFAASVRSMVPYLEQPRAFVGESDAFEGMTLTALTAEPGLSRRIRWFITDLNSVHYRELDGVDWIILHEPRATLAFEYADRAGVWKTQWRSSAAARQWIPSQIRLTAEDGRILWSTHLALHPVPVINFREGV